MKFAKSLGVTYSRYADDLTFSTKEKAILSEFPGKISELLAQLEFPRLRVNEKKTVHTSRAGLRTVTGITVTPSGELSVGRDRKRAVRAMYHRFMHGQLSPDDVLKLRGLLAFIEDIEPGFSSRLKRRYRSED